MKQSHIFESSVVVSGFILFTKLISFIKQAVIAAYYGATKETDYFFISSGLISSIIDACFAALAVCVLAIYTEKREEGGVWQANIFISDTLVILFPVAVLFTAIVIIVASPVSRLLAVGYSAAQYTQIARGLRELSICLIFSYTSICFGGLLNAEKRFLPSRSRSLIQSIFYIGCTLLLSKRMGIQALFIAYILTSISESLFLYFQARKTFTFHIERPFYNPSTKKLIKHAAPIMLGYAFFECNNLIDRIICTSVGTGVVTSLGYAASINTLINLLIISTITSILFSYLIDFIAKGNIEKGAAYVQKAITILWLLLIPVSIMCIFASREIVSVIYMRGAFNDKALVDTSRALCGYGVGFLFLASSEVLVKLQYACGDTKGPAKINMVAVLLNIGMSIVLSSYFGILGITLGTSISYILAMFLNYHRTRKYIGGNLLRNLRKTMLNYGVAAIVSITTVLVIDCMTARLSAFIAFLLKGSGVCMVYSLVLWLQKNEEFKYVMTKIKGLLTQTVKRGG